VCSFMNIRKFDDFHSYTGNSLSITTSSLDWN
jgi:hypothetical protein